MMNNDYMSGDYVTRQEFEELKAMLTCRGDGQSIEVDNTPGGQTIRSISVLTPETSSETEYVSVSYDSGTQKFTVSITDLPVAWSGLAKSSSSTPNRAEYVMNQISTGTDLIDSKTISAELVFDKPVTNQGLYIYASPKRTGGYSTDGFGEITWYNSGGLTPSDTDTRAQGISIGYGSFFAYMILNSDGTYSISYKPASVPVVAGHAYTPPSMRVQTSLNRVYLYDFIDPMSLSVISSAGIYYDYGSAPFDSDIIIGWSNGGNSVSLDEIGNSGSYNSYVNIGEVKVDANNTVLKCHLTINPSGAFIPHVGYTGTYTKDGTTLHITNGLIRNIT